MSEDPHPDDQQDAKPAGPVPISPAPISLESQQAKTDSDPSAEQQKAPISLSGPAAPLSPTPPVQPGSYYPPQPVAPTNSPYQQPPQQPAYPYQPPQMPNVPVPGHPGQYPPPQTPAAMPPGYPAPPPVTPAQPLTSGQPAPLQPQAYPPQSVPASVVPPSPSVPTPASPPTDTPVAPKAAPVQPRTKPAETAKPVVAKKQPASLKKTQAKKQQAKPPQKKTISKQASSVPESKRKESSVRKADVKPNPVSKKKNKVVLRSNEPVVTDPSLAVDAAPISESLDVQAVTVQMAPPWLVSMLLHMVIVIVLALFSIREEIKEVFTINATYAEQLGEQLDENVLILSEQELLNDSLSGSLTDLPTINEIAAPKTLTNVDQFSPNAAIVANVESPGIEFDARGQGSQKRALIKAYGGNATTEESVRKALEWLKRQQTRDGSWSLKGPYRDGTGIENKVAATAMALLAFQGAGHTDEVGDYQSNLKKGWSFLFREMDRDGNFIQGGVINQHVLYTQAQATIALCELYGMTKREDLREPAQRAIDYAVRIQAREGGWRYTPGSGSDTSVTGWFVMALQSARMSGLEVPDKTFQGITKFLDSVQTEGGSKYTYQVTNRQDATPAMTAEALLCRQYLGWDQNDDRLVTGITYLNANPINWDEPDVYYWYYATQVMHHAEGDAWEQWNRVMRQAIPEQQTQGGKEQGSWYPANDHNGTKAGRLFTTCFCTYMLEVYYRHLPIYSKIEVLNLQ